MWWRTVIMAVVGGTAAVIGGGKFANGALAGAFMHMFNAEFKDYPKKFLKVTNSDSIKYYMQRYGIGRADAEALRSWKIALDKQQMNKAMDVLGLGLSVGATVSPPAIALRLGLAALGVDLVQKDLVGAGIGSTAIVFHKSTAVATADIGYGIWQVIK